MYQAFISIMIIINFVVLALDHHPSNPMTENRKELMNIVFYFVFLFEMIVKMIGYGFTLYFQNSFNQFDFVVIVISTIEIIINFINLGNVSLSAIRALRVFRLLRMFKLAKTWKSFNDLLNLLFLTMKKVLYLTCILLLVWLLFAILGKLLFQYRMAFDERNKPVLNAFDFTKGKYRQGAAPDFNFDSILQSIMSVFVFFTSDGWCRILQDALRMPGINKLLAIVFFFALFVVGNLIIFNLFRAILMREFDQQSLLDKVELELKESTEETESYWKVLRDKLSTFVCFKRGTQV